MAVVANQYDPNNPNAPQTGGPGSGMPSQGSGGAPTGGGGASGGAAPQAGSTPSGAPDIRQYLNANQGAGQQLTQGITQNVQQQAGQIGQGIQSGYNQLNTSADQLQGKLNQGTAAANSAFQDPAKLLADYQAAQAAQKSNQPVSQQQQAATDQYNQFQQYNTGGYNPAIETYGQQAQQQQGQAQNQLQQFNQISAANPLAQSQLLQNTVRQANYTPGQQSLDQLFLQNQPGGAQQLQQNISQAQQGLGQQAGTASADAQSRLAALQGLSAQDQAYIKDLFTKGNATGQGMQGIGANVNQELTAAQQNAQNIQGGLATAFQSGNFTPEQLQQLGIAPGTQTWGLKGSDLQNAGGYSANQIAAGPGGLASVATPEEFARYNALNQLAGGPAGTAQQSIFGDATTAGGYKPVSFDTQKMQQQIDTQKQGLTSDYNSIMAQYLGNTAPGSSGHGMQAAQPDTLRPIINQLQAAQAAGTLTPDQANQIITSGTASLQRQYGTPDAQAGPQGWNTAFMPFLNYYNQKYVPASRSVLGQTSPDTTNLPMKGSPTNPQITAPIGTPKLGGKAPVDPNLTYMPGK